MWKSDIPYRSYRFWVYLCVSYTNRARVDVVRTPSLTFRGPIQIAFLGQMRSKQQFAMGVRITYGVTKCSLESLPGGCNYCLYHYLGFFMDTRASRGRLIDMAVHCLIREKIITPRSFLSVLQVMCMQGQRAA